METPPALRIEDLRLGYGSAPDTVHGATLEVPPGGTVAILGPSGGGKSTLLKAAAGLVAPRGGRLEVLGRPHPARPPAGAVGYVPQRLGLVRHGTVLQNALQGGLPAMPWWRSALRRPGEALLDRAHEAISAVGLEEKTHEPVHRLSGGQQRRVAVARTLVQRPQLLLADEFLGELDPVTVDLVVDAVKHLQRRTGMSAVFVEHHLDQAERIADAVFRLEDGRVHPVVPGWEVLVAP